MNVSMSWSGQNRKAFLMLLKYSDLGFSKEQEDNDSLLSCRIEKDKKFFSTFTKG